MIKTHKNNLIMRCKERGFTLEEVMDCVVEQNGDIWVIDENHPKYPKSPKIVEKPKVEIVPEGPGTELKKLLKLIGITSTPNCSCNAKANIMNQMGSQWCKDNIDTIIEWLRVEAQKRNLPFIEYGAKKIIQLAIYRAERKK